MTGVLDLQRRGQEIGRLRLGQKVVMENGKVRPARLDTWRVTTRSQTCADAVAALYGGEVKGWEGGLEVITSLSAIGVTIPPRDKIFSQHYEMWSKGGAQRRCNSQVEQISGEPCLCPHAADPDDEDEVARKAIERSLLASQNPPKACKLVTRLSVMIPDLPGLGVFRLDTGSYYAGVEIGDSAHLMEMARERGIFLPAVLRIDQRSRVAGGQTKKYPVPVLEVLVTLRQITSGELEAGGIAAQLPPAPVSGKAITAAREVMPDGPDRNAPRSGRQLESVPLTGQDAAGTLNPAITGQGHTLSDDEKYKLAQAIADECAGDVTVERFRTLWALAKSRLIEDEFVYITDDRADGPCDPLGERLDALWREKGRQA